MLCIVKYRQMNLEIVIDKNTCFYYWIQVISGWDAHAIDSKTYNYFESAISELTEPEESSLSEIKRILEKSEEARWILADLYNADLSRKESKKIVQLSEQFKDRFEAIWQDNSSNLESWLALIVLEDFRRFNEPMKKIVDFLDADFDLYSKYEVYLLQNSELGGAGGHTINNTQFLLLRPPGYKQTHKTNNLVAVIAHEYIHAIEFKSKISRGLFKKSYDTHIDASNIKAPEGYTWKMMYVEVLVYCFASTITGGYLRQEIYQKPRPTVNEMKDGFYRLVKQNRHNTNHIINWAAINILSDVEEYIENGKKIDQNITDKISKVFLEFYLTD